MREARKNISIQLLPVLIFAILLVSLYFPRLFPASPLIGLRALITSICVSFAIIFLSFQNRKIFTSYSLRVICAAYIFPLYLLIHGVINDKLGVSFFGNSDRNLGIATYFTCGSLFFLGSVLRNNYPESFQKIILFLGFFHLISLSTNYFGIISDRRLGNFLNSNPNGIYTGLILVLVTIWIAISTNKHKNKLFSAIFVLDLLVLNWIGTAQAIVGFIGTILVYGVYKAYENRIKVSSLFLIALILSFFSFTSYVSISNSPSRELSDSNSFYERLDIYKTSLKIIQESFPFGIGVDQFNLGYFKWNINENLKLVDNAHSIPLQLLSTVGIIGVVIFYGIIYQTIRLEDLEQNKSNLPIIFAIIFYIFSGFFAIQNPGIEVFVFFLLGFLWKSQKIVSRNSHRISVSLIRAINIGIVVPLIFSIFAQIQTFKALNGGFLPLAENSSKISVNSGKIYDIGILFRAGEYSIITGNKKLGLALLDRMIEISPVDQRTVALAFLLAEKYKDETLVQLGNNLNDAARS